MRRAPRCDRPRRLDGVFAVIAARADRAGGVRDCRTRCRPGDAGTARRARSAGRWRALRAAGRRAGRRTQRRASGATAGARNAAGAEAGAEAGGGVSPGAGEFTVRGQNSHTANSSAAATQTQGLRRCRRMGESPSRRSRTILLPAFRGVMPCPPRATCSSHSCRRRRCARRWPAKPRSCTPNGAGARPHRRSCT